MDSSSDVKHYAWPSSVNAANFVTVKPSLETKGDERINNFKNWKVQMLCLLESQDVLGFVDGEILPPPDNNVDDQKRQWRRTDRLVKGWILGSIAKEVLDLVREKTTARDVWIELHTIFNKREEVTNKEEEEEEEEEERGGRDDQTRYQSSTYLELYKAAQRGDWDDKLFQAYSLNYESVINYIKETALHVAVQTGKANQFVKKMVELMPPDALALKDYRGNTALHLAAQVGNTEAAIAMLDKNPDLLCIANQNNRLAVFEAAVHCHKGTLEYLISKSNLKKFEDHGREFGVPLLNAIIASEFYDVALAMVNKCPSLGRLREESDNESALSVLARTTPAFLSGESFSWWQKLIYYCTKQKPAAHEATYIAADIENPHACTNYNTSFQNIISGVKEKLESVVWKIIQNIVPSVRAIGNKKAMHQQALELVNYLCQQILTLPEMEATRMIQDSLIMAAKNGIWEIVEVIMEMHPLATFTMDPDIGGTIFHLAASHRFENVFSLIYSMTDRKNIIYDNVDNQKNNLMHICGKLAPPHRLNLVPGAALQMQQELQWFKEMENFVRPSRRTWPNINLETPRMLFTNEHQQLKAEGERWMKDTANACTIAAALIATVMFAAAFTLPGGISSDTGAPILVEQPAFILFAISDVVSMFTSITSLLMFLSILTSRYAEEDFLYVLPKRLSIGLLSLFISITFMLAAFSATMYLVFRGRLPWFLIPAAAFACLPVASFVLLQFPLLVDVVYSTYGPGIFGKKTTRVFY